MGDCPELSCVAVIISAPSPVSATLAFADITSLQAGHQAEFTDNAVIMSAYFVTSPQPIQLPRNNHSFSSRSPDRAHLVRRGLQGATPQVIKSLIFPATSTWTADQTYPALSSKRQITPIQLSLSRTQCLSQDLKSQSAIMHFLTLATLLVAGSATAFAAAEPKANEYTSAFMKTFKMLS